MKKMQPPPAPEGFNDFPENTEDQILYEKDLKPISINVPAVDIPGLPIAVNMLANPSIERVKTAKLTIKGRWEKLWFTTIDEGEEFTHTIEFCHGISSSESQTTEFGTDIGAKKGDLVSINAKLKQVTQSQYTVSENKKETYQIKKKVNTRTTTCWWHEVLTFETSGYFIEYAWIRIPGLKPKRVKIASQPYLHKIEVEQPTIPLTSYP